MPTMIEPDSALSQSSKSDENIAVVTESQEKGRKEDDAEDEIATVTGRENDTDNDVAQDAQTAKANNEDPSLITRKPEPKTRPISQQQLVAEVKGTYAGLVMVEAKCIEVDAKQMSCGISPETMMFLEKIPCKMIKLLQYGKMEPEKAIRIWLKAQKDPAEGDEKPSTIEAAEDLSTTSDDQSTAVGGLSITSDSQSTTPKALIATLNNQSTLPKAQFTALENLSTTSNDQSTASDNQLTTPEVSADSYVSEKSSPPVPSLKDCLSAFQVALELRAKELEWPESLELAKLTIEEIGEEGRKMVIDRNGLLDIGYDLVDRLLRDMETAAEKKAKDEEEEKAAREKEEIARGSKVIAEQLAAYAKGYTENADANHKETLTSMDETPGDTETQKTPSNGTQQATPIDTSLEEVRVAAKHSREDKADTAVGTVAHVRRRTPRRRTPRSPVPQRFSSLVQGRCITSSSTRRLAVYGLC